MSLDPKFSAKMAEMEGVHTQPNKEAKEVVFCVSCNTDLREKNKDLHKHLMHEIKEFKDCKEWEAWMEERLTK